MVRRRKDRGFTLVELLIALAISMVGLLGLMALQMIAIRANGASRNFAEAVSLAQEKLEMLQIAPVATFTTTAAVTEVLTPTSTPRSPSQFTYNRVTTITTNGTQAIFKVEVNWADANLSNGVVTYAATATTHKVTMYDLRSL